MENRADGIERSVNDPDEERYGRRLLTVQRFY
jgi:hypothetical protein